MQLDDLDDLDDLDQLTIQCFRKCSGQRQLMVVQTPWKWPCGPPWLTHHHPRAEWKTHHFCGSPAKSWMNSTHHFWGKPATKRARLKPQVKTLKVLPHATWKMDKHSGWFRRSLALFEMAPFYGTFVSFQGCNTKHNLICEILSLCPLILLATISLKDFVCKTLEVLGHHFIGWFPNRHYFSSGLSSSKRNHQFLNVGKDFQAKQFWKLEGLHNPLWNWTWIVSK